MTRLEKLRDQEANKHGTEFRKREIYKDGFNTASAEYEKIIKELEDALRFAAMPITSESPTTESLLESFRNDTERIKQALQKLKEFRDE